MTRYNEIPYKLKFSEGFANKDGRVYEYEYDTIPVFFVVKYKDQIAIFRSLSEIDDKFEEVFDTE